MDSGFTDFIHPERQVAAIEPNNSRIYPQRPVVRIEKLAAGGDGLGHMEDGIVFVPLTAPGDVVTLKNARKRRGVWFAEPDEFIERSSERTDPPCPWFGECGGCQWMHLQYPAQLRWKEDIFIQAVKRIARLEDLPPVAIHPSPSDLQYRYRTRLQIKGGEVGFYRHASNNIVSWKHCMQLPDTLNHVAADLRAWFSENRAPAVLRSCEAALSPVDGSVTLCWTFSRSRKSGGAARVTMDAMEKRELPGNVNLAGQAAYDERGKSIAARGTSLSLEVSSITIPASPGTFFQVNPQINAILVDRVLGHLRSEGVSTLLDLYCGNGNFTLPAAAAGIEAVGVEDFPGSINDAVAGTVPSARFIEMDVGRFLAREDTLTNAVIVDPPRTGLPAEVAAILGARRYPCLIYVSCDPATLARDLSRLTGDGYVLYSMELFDMFPQTFHSETLVVLKG